MRQIAEDVLKKRYYQPGERGWIDVCYRVANYIGHNEFALAYYEAMVNLELIPNSPALMNAGAEKGGSLSACYAVPVYDSIEEIFDAVKACALIHKEGGGTGISLSRLRPKGSEVKGTGKISSGPVSFMHVFNAATETIKQGGKRRGANLGSLDVHHPDIKEFITCKSKEGELSNFNISVIVDDEFMKHPDPEVWNLIVEGNWKNGEPGILFKDARERDNKRKELGELSETNPCITGDTKILTKKYGERPIADFVDEEIEIWNGFEWSLVTPQITGYEQPTIIVEVMLSFESQTRNHIIKSICCTPYHKFILENGDRIEASELKPYDKLSSFKLPDGRSISQTIHNIIDYKEKSIAHKVYCLNEPKNHSFVANGILIGNCGETALFPWESCNLASINLMKCVIDGKFDYEKFYSLVRLGVRFLNDMIDVNLYPLPQIEEATKKTRKIGLGVMGFADVLIALGMRYGDDESLQFANDLFGNMRQVAETESELIGGNNAALLSIAPTGSISIFAGVSSGIEPNFGYVYDRTTQASGEKVKYREVHPMFEEAIKKRDEIYSDGEVFYKFMSEYGSIQEFDGAKDLKNVFVTAKDIKPRDHVRMQAVIQKHVDQAISKTINCPESTTKEEISNLIQFAWREGCKGLTIYREGSRSDVVLETNATKQTEEVKEKDKEKDPIEIPSEIDLKSIRMNSACGILWVKTGFLHGSANPVEVWIDAEKGGCRANLEFIARLISKLLQEGVSHEVACKQGDKVFCPACVNNAKGEAEGYSCANLISKGIKEGIRRREEDIGGEVMKREAVIDIANMCPECGEQLIHIDGCVSCVCGFSRCK